MGLDTSHNCWHGPYSSFNRFRHSLAKQIGINLDDYAGYGGKYIVGEGITGGGTIELSSIKHDVQPLLDHSDCDGHLSVTKCKKIVKGLNSILENYNYDIEPDHVYMIEKITQFRDGCLDAIERKEAVEFH